MKYLLDTCTFLWICEGSQRLSERAVSSFQNPDNDVYLSCVSGWEIAVKFKRGKLPLPQTPALFVPSMREQHHIAKLQLEEAAVLRLDTRPDNHRDPFDRMLICQALLGGLTLLTPDPDIRSYPVNVEW